MTESNMKHQFYKWSKEILEEDRFKEMQDLEKWALFVRKNPSKWKRMHTKFIHAVYNKWKQSIN